MTDLNPRRSHVTRHEIYTLIPHALNYYFLFLSLIYLFPCLFLSHYIVSIWLLSSVVVIRYQGTFFCAYLHEVIPNSNLYCWPTEEVTHKASLEVPLSRTYCVTMYWRKIRMKLLRCCSVITLTLTSKSLWRRLLRVVCTHVPTTIQCG